MMIGTLETCERHKNNVCDHSHPDNVKRKKRMIINLKSVG